MSYNYKDLHIGKLIKQRVTDCEMDVIRICNFFKCTEEEIKNMYEADSLEMLIVLKWSTLLKYDFFRIYSNYLILYAPPSNSLNNKAQNNNNELPRFRKNVYTKEIIDFILDSIKNNEKTMKEVIEGYNIPKTTLYKWVKKYSTKPL